MPHVDDIKEAILGHRYHFSNEVELQDGIALALTEAGISYGREESIFDAGRIDFLLGDGVGIEVKIKGSAAEVTRQLHRYAQSFRIKALILVASRMQLLAIPTEVSGKPVHRIIIYGGLQ